MATVLRQKENRSKSMNGSHVVSNFAQRRSIAIQFPAIVEDISKKLHLFPSFKTTLFEAQPAKIRKDK